jgi:hypothetical protein
VKLFYTYKLVIIGIDGVGNLVSHWVGNLVSHWMGNLVVGDWVDNLVGDWVDWVGDLVNWVGDLVDWVGDLVDWVGDLVDWVSDWVDDWVGRSVSGSGGIGRSRRRLVGGSGGGGGMVSGSWGGMIRLGFILGVDGLSFVADVSDITVLVSGVPDDLGTTIGKSDPVFPSGLVPVSLLRMAKVGVAVLIIDGVLESILGRLVFVLRLMVSSSGSGLMISGSGFVCGSGLVGGSGLMIGRCGLVGGSGRVSGSGLVSGSRLVSRSGLVSWSGLMIGGSGLINRSGSGLINWSGSGLVSGLRSGFVGRSGSVFRESRCHGGEKGEGKDLAQHFWYVWLKSD